MGCEKVHNHNWNDLKFVLTVAETGTVSGAARRLGVNHATVLRHVAAFEAAHGGAIFARGPGGYKVITERLPVIEAARLAAAAMERVGGLMQGNVEGARPVRVTSTDSICQTVLPKVLAVLACRGDLPPIELCSGNIHRDLGRLEADITLRPAEILPSELVGVPAVPVGFGVYAAAGARGRACEHWLGLSGPLAGSAAAAWLVRRPDALNPVFRADSFVVLAEMAAQGLGRAVIPCVIGDRHLGLDRLCDFGEVAVAQLWVASHAELAGSQRLAAVRAALADELQAWAQPLRGRPAVSG